MNRCDNWAAAAKYCSVIGNEAQDYVSVIRELEIFLESEEGKKAKSMLFLTNKHIVLATIKEFPHPESGTTVYALDRYMRFMVYYPKKTPDDKIGIFPEQVEAKEAIFAAARYNYVDPQKFMDWLKAQLDEIAQSVLQQ